MTNLKILKRQNKLIDIIMKKFNNIFSRANFTVTIDLTFLYV